jgi:hypothetical protein
MRKSSHAIVFFINFYRCVSWLYQVDCYESTYKAMAYHAAILTWTCCLRILWHAAQFALKVLYLYRITTLVAAGASAAAE